MRKSLLVASAMSLAMSSVIFCSNLGTNLKDTIPIELLGLNNPIRKERLRTMGMLRSKLNYRPSRSTRKGNARERAKYLRKNNQELQPYVI